MRRRIDLQSAFSYVLLCVGLSASPALTLAAQDSTAPITAPLSKGTASNLSSISQGPTTQFAQLADRRRREEALTQGSIAVLYPQIEEPYQSVFATIARGIESQSKLPVRTYAIPNSDLQDLGSNLRRNGTRGIIVLGRKGYQTIDALDKDLPILVGGVLSVPEDPRYSLISLTPSPVLLFAKMKALAGQIRRIYVVHNPKRTEAQIRNAREAAREQGLELIVLEASDVSAAARQYDGIMQSMDGRTDALWLPDDPSILNNNIVLPLILERSWNRSIPVFSSTVAHVARGVLFSMHPDNYRMGQTLAISMSTMLTEKGRRYHDDLRDVRVAINQRTARHLGLNLAGHIDIDID